MPSKGRWRAGLATGPVKFPVDVLVNAVLPAIIERNKAHAKVKDVTGNTTQVDHVTECADLHFLHSQHGNLKLNLYPYGLPGPNYSTAWQKGFDHIGCANRHHTCAREVRELTFKAGCFTTGLFTG